MATPPEVDQLVASVNDVSQMARTLFFGLLLVALTMAAIVVGTTDEAVLRDAVEVAPTLGVRISVSLAHVFAPIILLFLHANALIQLDLLGIRWVLLDQAMTKAGLSPDERKHQHARIHSFAAIQHLAGAQAKWTRRLLQFITWLTVVGLPLAILLVLQIGFLRYQSARITHVQQAVVVFDTLILCWFLCRRQQRQGDGHSAMCGPWYCRSALRFADRLVLVIGPILTLHAMQVHWHKELKNSPLNDVLDYLLLAIMLIGIFMLVLFLFRRGNRAWLLLVVPVVSVALANPPQGQEAKDIRWVESFAYSHWRQEDTTPRQDDDSFVEGFCSLEIPKNAETSWPDALLWPSVRLCNPIDIYICPYLGWGCRYLRLSNTIQMSNSASLSGLTGTTIMTDTEYKALQVRAVGLHLRNRNLRYANFKDTSLFGADLIGADLRQANLEEANLQGAWFDNADLRRVVLDGADLETASLDHATLDNASLRDTFARYADLAGASLVEASLNRSSFPGAVFDGAELTRVHARYAYFATARFVGASLKDANLIHSNFTGAKLMGASLEGATLDGADFTMADLHGATLAGAKLSGARIDPKQLGEATWLYAQLADVRIDNVPPLATPSPQELEADARIVAAEFMVLACSDDKIGEGIIRWVSRSYRRDGVTSASWEWISARAILGKIKDAVLADQNGDKDIDPQCPKLDMAVLDELKKPLDELNTPGAR